MSAVLILFLYEGTAVAQTYCQRGCDTVEETGDPSTHLRRVARQLQRVNEGKFNAIVDVTLNANATTTSKGWHFVDDRTCLVGFARFHRVALLREARGRA
jgi:hypothetical protein